MRRTCSPLLSLAALTLPLPLAAAEAPAFDLPGPALSVTVTRGSATLPIDRVPTLAEGDRIAIAADLPSDQRARYLLVSAFLDGATNPPPKDWIVEAETWKRKDKDRLLSLTVSKGARQMVLFLVPDTGGAKGSIADAVRGRPGEFVRATQDLNQASLDRSRLNAFVTAIEAQENVQPAYLRTVAPTLARSLGIRLNEECLARVVELQAACLLENRDALVLADIHSHSVTDTLTGAPTDLAMQLSYTREAGLGYYSPYIAVVRDLARVFGAFNNPQFRYLPTLSLRRGETVSLLLNTAPSFSKPKSVLVAAMPVIGASTMPRLRGVAGQPSCGARPDLVLPVEGAPLVYSTAYAHDMTLRVKGADGRSADVPVTARADRGGFVAAQALPAGLFAGAAEGQLRGRWGFDALEGPRFDLRFPDAAGWKAEGDRLVAGRDETVTLAGTAAACVSAVTVGGEGAERALEHKVTGPGTIAVTLPLKDAPPGEVTLRVRQYGVSAPTVLSLRAYREASRVEAIAWHRGDATATITGQRLDAVAAVEIGAARFTPGELARSGDMDRLTVTAPAVADLPAGTVARVTLKDGRTVKQPVTMLPPRPTGTIVSRSLVRKADAAGPALVPVAGAEMLPDDSRLTFAVGAAAGVRFAAGDTVEVTMPGRAPVTLAAGRDVRLQGADVLVATLDPAALGAAAGGPLSFRIVRGPVAGEWRPLATLVRLPALERVACAEDACTLHGRDLFLIGSVAADAGFAQATTVPSGYTAAAIAIPRSVAGSLYVRLRDAPETTFTLAVR